MANKGKALDGTNLISQETWDLMHRDPILRYDAGLSKFE